jgi:hypothetical protein
MTSSPSALDEIDREAAQTRLFVLRVHVGAGLTHRGDHAVKRDTMAPVAVQRQRRRGERQ